MIVEYSSPMDRKVRGTSIAKGQPLYAIRHEGMYFIWSYSNKAMAEYIDGKVYPQGQVDVSANWRYNLNQLIPTDASHD
jgi:hypothetical protein